MNLLVGSVEDGGEFDLVIAACGYESRSRYMVECRDFNAPSMIAFGYGHGEELAFEENRSVFARSGFRFEAVDDDAFEERIERLIRDVRDGRDKISVLLDISCFTRLRLAQILEALAESGPFILEVFYALAAFNPPGGAEPTNQYLCPVTDYLSGWTGDANKAVALVAGIGYEQMMALGIMEHIDPYESWLFFPRSPLREYDEAVRDANALLLREVSESNVLDYPVLDGSVILRKIFSLVDSLRREYRCILMPLGPKVFAFCALLAGCAFRDVSVWRASAGKHYQPKDRAPSQYVAGFRVSFDRKNVA